jgi:hypothetical protein
MMCSPIVARTELMRLLAGLPATQQLDEVLRTGRLPVDDRSRAIIDKGLLSIKHEYALWDTTGEQPDWAKAFATIAQASDALIQALENDTGRQAVAIMEEGAVWRLPIKIVRNKELTELYETSLSYSQLYEDKSRKNIQRIEPENWLFDKFYQLYEEIKGTRPGIAGPLYRFTMEGAKLLGIKVGVTQEAFCMRIRRVLNEQREVSTTEYAFRRRVQRALRAGIKRAAEAIGSLGSVLYEQNVGRD